MGLGTGFWNLIYSFSLRRIYRQHHQCALDKLPINTLGRCVLQQIERPENLDHGAKKKQTNLDDLIKKLRGMDSNQPRRINFEEPIDSGYRIVSRWIKMFGGDGRLQSGAGVGMGIEVDCQRICLRISSSPEEKEFLTAPPPTRCLDSWGSQMEEQELCDKTQEVISSSRSLAE